MPKKPKPTEKKYDTRPKRVTKTTKRWSTRSRQRSPSKHDEDAEETEG